MVDAMWQYTLAGIVDIILWALGRGCGGKATIEDVLPRALPTDFALGRVGGHAIGLAALRCLCIRSLSHPISILYSFPPNWSWWVHFGWLVLARIWFVAGRYHCRVLQCLELCFAQKGKEDKNQAWCTLTVTRLPSWAP